MNEEKMKIVIEAANKITNELVASFDPESQGLIISTIITNIHKEYGAKIDMLNEQIDGERARYESFKESIDRLAKEKE
jgi:hypothetical protein